MTKADFRPNSEVLWWIVAKGRGTGGLTGIRRGNKDEGSGALCRLPGRTRTELQISQR
jgi:hypothetical protein